MSSKLGDNLSELDRILALSNFGIDYSESNKGIERLSEIAAKIAGAQVCQINLIDSFTQWTVASVGFDQKSMPIESSICSHTIRVGKLDELEIPDLSKDSRFAEQSFVTGDLTIKYYLGFPLTTSDGFNIGTLCVMDDALTKLSEEKKDLLKLITNQVVERLQVNKLLQDLSREIKEVTLTKNKLAHDIRGPITGIVGLSDAILQFGEVGDIKEAMEFVSLINSSSKVVIELAESILNEHIDSKSNVLNDSEINLVGLKNKIEQLFAPQALLKNIKLDISIRKGNHWQLFNKRLVLQIVGNLLSNSIKFTPDYGEVSASFDLNSNELKEQWLSIEIKDSGVGISDQKKASILKSNVTSELGTKGEAGYGLGLNLVKILLDKLEGSMEIISEMNQGTQFLLKLKVS